MGGLCNRLRAILSYRALHGSVQVVWDANEYVSHAHFLDVFEPLHGVSFVEGAWDVEDYAPAVGAPEGWELGYAELRPVVEIRSRLIYHLPFYGWRCRPDAMILYDAVHVRRTDHVPNVESRGDKVEHMSEFVRWALAGQRDVYVATDNLTTQRGLLLLLEGRGQIGTELPDSADVQGLTDHHRNGTLADAVVDLYVCAGATRFKGTRGSSFTDTIEILRRLRA